MENYVIAALVNNLIVDSAISVEIATGIFQIGRDGRYSLLEAGT